MYRQVSTVVHDPWLGRSLSKGEMTDGPISVAHDAQAESGSTGVTADAGLHPLCQKAHPETGQEHSRGQKMV